MGKYSFLKVTPRMLLILAFVIFIIILALSQMCGSSIVKKENLVFDNDPLRGREIVNGYEKGFNQIGGKLYKCDDNPDSLLVGNCTVDDNQLFSKMSKRQDCITMKNNVPITER